MNPFLSRLGYGPDDRAVVFHMDDLGMCQATLPAFDDLLNAGLVSSAATMVPCPWFPAVAAYCRENPGADVGVHTTLTCEWDLYRWGPVSTRDTASGLLDGEGCLPPTSPAVWESADEDAVRTEIGEQLARALAAGVDVTHVDSHMGALFHPRLIDAYADLALGSRLPCMTLRLDLAEAAEGAARDLAEASARVVRRLEAEGAPVFDAIVGLPLDRPEERVAQATRAFDGLPTGLSVFILHPARDTPELRAIAPDWPGRVADLEAFTSPELRAYVRDAGIHVVGYRELRDAMRTG
jgi:predicted glycoside hydrolase/deacetylase ChbG (UPF0249 family)